MKLKMIKIARYGSNINMEDKYSFYCMSTKQIIDPDIDRPISYRTLYREKIYRRIYSSPLRRAITSAEYLSSDVVILQELNEIKFDLEKLLSRDQYLQHGSKLVRELFIRAFIANSLLESRTSIIKRVEKVKELALGSNIDKMVCVSHSFFMKVLEASMKGCNLVTSPEMIRSYINVDQKTYQFGEGFNIRVQSTRGEI